MSPSTVSVWAGSPPRAWGGPRDPAEQPAGLRLTPTCVGRTMIPSPYPGECCGSPPRAWGGRAQRAHPHVRGEDSYRPQSFGQVAGSPPRAWGGQLQAAELRPGGRLTPTCVGRTQPSHPYRWLPSAHPHVRGEDSSTSARKITPGGSPPRAWGGRAEVDSDHLPGRLTPTCVGRTMGPGDVLRRDPAHPHVRGEDDAQLAAVEAGGGSPPRAWGGLHPQRLLPPDQRLTPTCVGRTFPRSRVGLMGSAHPHVRGEDAAMSSPRGLGNGSPPRAWGGPRVCMQDRHARRLTPTCVGRTAWSLLRRGSSPAHPHVRGEDLLPTAATSSSSGSPPRAWGGPRRAWGRGP